MSHVQPFGERATCQHLRVLKSHDLHISVEIVGRVMRDWADLFFSRLGRGAESPQQNCLAASCVLNNKRVPMAVNDLALISKLQNAKQWFIFSFGCGSSQNPGKLLVNMIGGKWMFIHPKMGSP